MVSINLKRGLLKKSRLYIIVDSKVLGNRSIFDTVRKIKGKGCDIIQFRDKISNKESILKCAQTLHKILLNSKTIFIINDYIDIAKIVDSDGVHLGQDDLPLDLARKILGKDKFIGISCHNIGEAIEAQDKGADYISIGPIFTTATKPEYKAIGLDLIKECKKKIKIPFFIIGGINRDNINQVLSWGTERIAICRAVCQAKNTSSIIKNFSRILH